MKKALKDLAVSYRINSPYVRFLFEQWPSELQLAWVSRLDQRRFVVLIEKR